MLPTRWEKLGFSVLAGRTLKALFVELFQNLLALRLTEFDHRRPYVPPAVLVVVTRKHELECRDGWMLIKNSTRGMHVVVTGIDIGAAGAPGIEHISNGPWVGIGGCRNAPGTAVS